MNKDNIPSNIVFEPNNRKINYKEKNKIQLNFMFVGDSATGGKTLFLLKYENGNCGNTTLSTLGIDSKKFLKMINKD